MRWIVICCLFAFPTVGTGQVPLERFEVDISRYERLDIEVIPIIVFDSSIVNEPEQEAIDEAVHSLTPQFHEMFSAVHEAMHTLGLNYFQYSLYYGNHFHILVCEEATLYAEQTCAHGDLGIITDLPNFINDLHDGEPPPKGTIQLNVVILENKLSWRGILGAALWWYWGGDSSLHHWTNRACRAWALLSMQVIAHELGHCFGLIHNEQDTDSGYDLMVSHYAHFDWVKESNKEIVQDFFSYPPPVPAFEMTAEPIMVNPKY